MHQASRELHGPGPWTVEVRPIFQTARVAGLRHLLMSRVRPTKKISGSSRSAKKIEWASWATKKI